MLSLIKKMAGIIKEDNMKKTSNYPGFRPKKIEDMFKDLEEEPKDIRTTPEGSKIVRVKNPMDAKSIEDLLDGDFEKEFKDMADKEYKKMEQGVKEIMEKNPGMSEADAWTKYLEENTPDFKDIRF